MKCIYIEIEVYEVALNEDVEVNSPVRAFKKVLHVLFYRSNQQILFHTIISLQH